jgi:hypothetical protein
MAMDFKAHESVDAWDQTELPGARQVTFIPLVADQLKFDPVAVEIVVRQVASRIGNHFTLMAVYRPRIGARQVHAFSLVADH